MFWQAALGYVPREPPEDGWVVLTDPSGAGPNLSLDRVAEERVPGEAELAVDDERDAVVRMPRGSDRLDAQPARLDRVGHHRDREALRELRFVLDVVRMAVRAKDVRRAEPLSLDRFEQRLQRRAAVDEDRDAPRLVADEERVREPAGVHRALDDH